MGYMGLSHWCDSDNAADFRYMLQAAVKKPNPKVAVRALIRKEVKDKANCYNTAGPVSIALVMEDEGAPANPKYEDPGTPVFSKLLSKPEFRLIIDGLKAQIAQCEKSDEWEDEQNRLWHKQNFERMLQSVIRKSYKE